MSHHPEHHPEEELNPWSQYIQTSLGVCPEGKLVAHMSLVSLHPFRASGTFESSSRRTKPVLGLLIRILKPF